MKFFLFLMVMLFSGIEGQCKAPLKVGIVVDYPFVIKDNSNYSGIAVDLWTEIAHRLQQPFTFIEYEYDKGEDPFDALEKGKVDLLVGTFSPTIDRYMKAEFTLPFYIDKVVAIAPIDYLHNTLLFIKLFFVSVSGITLVFIIVFMAYIHLLWYYEKTYDEKIPSSYRLGISYLFWTHVLRGRLAEMPKSLVGKFLLLFQRTAFYIILLMLNVTIFSYFAASMQHYASPVQSLSDLEKRIVGAIKDSKAYKAASHRGLRVVSFPSLSDGIKALEDRKIGAFLADFSDAEYYLTKYPETHLSVSDFSMTLDNYVFAVTKGSPLTRLINQQMLSLRKENVPEKICKAYLIKGIENCKL